MMSQPLAESPSLRNPRLKRWLQRLGLTPRSLMLTALAGVLVGNGLNLLYQPAFGRRAVAAETDAAQLERIPFDGARAYEYLKQICDLGPRPTGSEAMRKQQDLLETHFKQLGGQVERQEFEIRNPNNGAVVPGTNLLVHWHPQSKERVLFCAHYDTRPFPDRDRRNPRGTFVGANDGASGAAILMELGRHMKDIDCKFGVSFAFWDAEEFVFSDRRGDPYFLGAEYFARQYVADPPDYKFRYGVLLDMVGDSSLQLFQERHSMFWPETRPLVEDIWRTAERREVTEFIPRQKHEVRDDHLPLNNVAKIPTCDIIDFDYRYWHTQQDTPERCSALTLAKVGWVLKSWLETGALVGRK